MPACNFPEHHQGGNGGFPWGLLLLCVGVVAVGTSSAFAQTMHALMVAVLAACAAVVVVGVAGLALWMHHVRWTDRRDESRRIYLSARFEPRQVGEPARRQIGAPREAVSVTDAELRRRFALRAKGVRLEPEGRLRRGDR